MAFDHLCDFQLNELIQNTDMGKSIYKKIEVKIKVLVFCSWHIFICLCPLLLFKPHYVSSKLNKINVNETVE